MVDSNRSNRSNRITRSIKSFVLRKGRITRGQESAIERLGKSYIISEKDITPAVIKKAAGNNSIIAEIGFGNGEATAEIAENNSGIFYLGIEVYMPGVGNLLKLIEEKKLENIKIINYDAVEVLEKLKGEIYFDGFHIFFPDPWPKSRQKKRRLINSSFTELIAYMLKPDRYIYAVTDWEDYSIQISEIFGKNRLLEKADDNARKPYRPDTRFERKGIEKNHRVYELLYKKKDCPV